MHYETLINKANEEKSKGLPSLEKPTDSEAGNISIKHLAMCGRMGVAVGKHNLNL